MAITTLIYDPSPGVTPGDGSIIRTDQHDAIADLLNGISSENYNLVQKYRLVSTTAVFALTDFLLCCDGTAAGFVVTLPSAATAGIARKIIAIKKVDATAANVITITPDGIETIDGVAGNMRLQVLNETVVLQSDGTNWKVIDHYLKPYDSGELKFANLAGTFFYTIKTSAITTSYDLTIPEITANDTLMTLGVAQTISEAKTFLNSKLLLRNPANTFSYTIVPAAIAADRSLNLPLTTGTDTLAVLSLAQTFSSGAKTFNSSILKIRNPGDTFSYTIVAAAIADDRSLTLPLITGTDTLVVLGLAQTFTAAQSFSSSLIINAAGSLQLFNPAGTFKYSITPAAILADRILNLPLISATDTLVSLGLDQTFTGVLTFGVVAGVTRIQNTLGTALGTTGTIDLDFSLAEVVTMAAMTGNVTFTTSNLASGRTKTIRIIGGASAFTFTFPAWKFIGAAAPASLAIGKYAVLTLTSISTTDAEVVAAYAVQP